MNFSYKDYWDILKGNTLNCGSKVFTWIFEVEENKNIEIEYDLLSKKYKIIKYDKSNKETESE